jgi:hypothetical protein
MYWRLHFGLGRDDLASCSFFNFHNSHDLPLALLREVADGMGDMT